MGDLGRSLYNSLTNEFEHSSETTDVPAGETLVVQPMASTVIYQAKETNPSISKTEALLYPLRTNLPMARLRTDFIGCFYESSWREKAEKKHPLTIQLLDRVLDKSLVQEYANSEQERGNGNSAHSVGRLAALLQATANSERLPSLRISSDTSDVPTYMLERENRGL